MACCDPSIAPAAVHLLCLIPTQSSRRFGGDAVGHAVDALHLIDNQRRRFAQEFMGEGCYLA